MRVARDLVTAAVALLVGFVGLSLQFTDFSGWETLYSRALLVGCYFVMAGFLVGYVRPKRWLFALFAAAGGFMWIYPAVLCAVAGYAGALVRIRQLVGPWGGGWILRWLLNAATLYVVAYLPELLPVHWSTMVSMVIAVGLLNTVVLSWTGRRAGTSSLVMGGVLVFVVDAVVLGVVTMVQVHYLPLLTIVVQGALVAAFNITLLATSSVDAVDTVR